jgi:Family of unknown function (DUF5683)
MVIAAFLCAPLYGHAQVTGSRSDPGSLLALRERLGVQRVAVDSTGQVAVQFADTSSVERHQKSALAAVLFSAVPGGGQIYNGSYWKVPIVWGIQGFFVYEWILNNRTYRSYRTEFSDSLAAGPPYQSSDLTRQVNLNTLQDLRNAAQDQRDSYAWYIAGTYLLSILDAYVDAELSGFDVSPGLGSAPSGKSVAVSFSLKF